MSRTAQVVGKTAMAEHGGWFRTVARQNPSKFERVMADLESAIREGEDIQNPGGYFRKLWGLFAG